jgi:hypothetical protein
MASLVIGRKPALARKDHARPLSDGGPDHPAHVIALCPNCYRRVHAGADGEAYNARHESVRALFDTARRRTDITRARGCDGGVRQELAAKINLTSPARHHAERPSRPRGALRGGWGCPKN